MSPTTQPPAEAGSNQTPDPEEEQQAAGREADAAMWTIVGHQAASIAVYGGAGYLLGRWTGHPILLLFGVLFGVVLSLWFTVRSAHKSASEQPGSGRSTPR